MIEIPFSGLLSDQINLSKSGGYIALKPNDKTVFRFDNQNQYNKYLELKNK